MRFWARIRFIKSDQSIYSLCADEADQPLGANSLYLIGFAHSQRQPTGRIMKNHKCSVFSVLSKLK